MRKSNSSRLLEALPRLVAAFAISKSINSFASDVIPSGGYLYRGQSIQSLNGAYTLTMQSDGSLVMYRTDGTVSYRMAKNGDHAVMQADGNFVEYSYTGQALWDTATGGYTYFFRPPSLHIYNDGSMAIISATDGACGTCPYYAQYLWTTAADPTPVGAPKPAPTGMIASSISGSPPPSTTPTIPRGPEFNNSIATGLNPRY